MSLGLSGLLAVLWLNLWLMAGSLVLVHAVTRQVVHQPRQIVHSIALMMVWPWLLGVCMLGRRVKSLDH